MPCSRCEKTPILFTELSDVYVTVPTNHHVALFEGALEKKHYLFETLEGRRFLGEKRAVRRIFVLSEFFSVQHHREKRCAHPFAKAWCTLEFFIFKEF